MLLLIGYGHLIRSTISRFTNCLLHVCYKRVADIGLEKELSSTCLLVLRLFSGEQSVIENAFVPGANGVVNHVPKEF